MKPISAFHILTNTRVNLYLVNTAQDIDFLLQNNVITDLHVKGITSLLNETGQVVVNQKGGYCNPKGVYTLKISKTEFVKRSHIGNYGKGKNKILAIFYDWQEGSYVEDGITKRYVGYKYMFAFRGITKKQAIDQVYEILFNFSNANLVHQPIKTRVVVEDKNRFKVPLGL